MLGLFGSHVTFDFLSWFSTIMRLEVQFIYLWQRLESDFLSKRTGVRLTACSAALAPPCPAATITQRRGPQVLCTALTAAVLLCLSFASLSLLESRTSSS